MEWYELFHGFHGLFHTIPYGMGLCQKIHQVSYGFHIHSMDWIPWIPWNSPWNPYGMGLYQKIHQVPYGFHTHSMDWIPWIPWIIPHGFQVESRWNQYLGLVKDGLKHIYIVYINLKYKYNKKF